MRLMRQMLQQSHGYLVSSLFPLTCPAVQTHREHKDGKAEPGDTPGIAVYCMFDVLKTALEGGRKGKPMKP